jgi:CubicO group peptidase (beta-lactamase class C family)
MAETPALCHRRDLLAAGALTALAATAPALAATGSNRLAALAAHADQLVREQDYSGVLLIAEAGHIRLRRSWGQRQRAEALPNTLETRFNIASIGKMFTTAAILRLVEAGRLQLDAPLAAAWPDCPAGDLAHRITVAQLLSHTAGIGNALWALPPAQWEHVRRQTDLYRMIASAPPEGPPGGAVSYSNDGFVALGALIERLTGEDYASHVTRTLLMPLGMASTAFGGAGDLQPNQALPYVRDLDRPGAWRTALAGNTAPACAAGGGTSSAPDLLRFGQAWLAGRVVGPAMMQAWRNPAKPFRDGEYARGLQLQRINGDVIEGHTGGHHGAAAELMIWPQHQRVAVLLHNGEVEPCWDLAHAVRATFSGDYPAEQDFRHTQRIAALVAANGPEAGLAAHAAAPGRTLRASLIEALGNRAWHRGHAQAARNLLQFNVALDPKSPDARWYLAELHRRRGDRQAALAAYRAYLDLVPGDADALGAIDRLGISA